jgi:hypothetical protein
MEQRSNLLLKKKDAKLRGLSNVAIYDQHGKPIRITKDKQKRIDSLVLI